MRQYLHMFWGLVLAGMVFLTAVYPECRQSVAQQYPDRCYYVYNSNGDRISAYRGFKAVSIMRAGSAPAERRF